MITAIFAASVALVQNDIKIVVYSTCSQLGYMFFVRSWSLSCSDVSFIYTCFFQSIIILGAGSVIHAFKDEQDIRNMGGGEKIYHILIHLCC